MENLLKRRLHAGEPLFGAWLGMASPPVAELMACAGFDFLVIDLEHSPASLSEAVAMMRACDAGGTPTIVRVPWNDHVFVKRILDAGAMSLMIPMIETAQEAAEAVAAARFPPAGRRGYAAPAMRCSRYGFIADYTMRANDELMLIAQIESAAAADAAQAIAAVDGVDLVLIGINDLAGSIGLLEQLDRPEVDALVRKAEAGVRAAGKMLGTVPSARMGSPALFADGYSLVAGTVDSVLLREAAKAELASLRESGWRPR